MDILYRLPENAATEDITLALEAGVDGLLAPAQLMDAVARLARCPVRESLPPLLLSGKADEEEAAARLAAGEDLVLALGWEILPVENLLAHPNPRVSGRITLEVASFEDARLASGILERGVAAVAALPQALPDLPAMVRQLRHRLGRMSLEKARILSVSRSAMGHRVCVDTVSLLHKGQGMLLGNSSAFTFLVHAETESNPYVAARPFRVNAGGVHGYALMPGDLTRYAQELASGDEVLIVDYQGQCQVAAVGRVKIEARPMLYIEAEVGDKRGGIFLQNAETIRLVRPSGEPVSVVELKVGDEVLCHLDQAGRHFGMRVSESICE